MKKIETVTDIDALHGQYESDELEVKREPINTDKLIKTIQGMANYKGGIIILGLDCSDGKIDVNKSAKFTFPITIPRKGDPKKFENFDKYKLHIFETCKNATENFSNDFFS